MSEPMLICSPTLALRKKPLQIALFPTRPLTDYFDPVAYGLKKFGRSSVKVVVHVWPEECEGVIEDFDGSPLEIVDLPSPRATFHTLAVYCRYEPVKVGLVELHLDRKLRPKRKNAGRRARVWFVWKLRKWNKWARRAA